MAVAVGKLRHDARVSVVEHLDELRTRLIVSFVAIGVAFGVCMWQNHALLRLLDRPLSRQTQRQIASGEGPLGATYTVQQSTRALATQLQAVVGTLERPGSGASDPARASLRALDPQLRAASARLAVPAQGDKPVTLGIGEPFTTTLGVVLLFAIVLALPLVLYELYGFVLPAFSPAQQRAATPLMLAIPFLFIAGVAFGYFVVLPAAVRFLQNFNSSQFNVLVQASQYYHFAGVTLLAMGLLFQVPVAVLAATRAEVVSVAQLRRNRRYALLACGALAAFLPGDAITLVLEATPLYLLFELSLLVASLAERRARRKAHA
ncbi:MAG TPA: twin-arginine translocase subunit TatC [Solirubrobacteraceae bacterium]|jgi:sec-independent protein translocase protein TatC|nr:twin-arginine translocase subunit TatC [Solirubrobacteraceae bacterium]